MTPLSIALLAVVVALAGLCYTLWRLFAQAARSLAGILDGLRAGGAVTVRPPDGGPPERYLVTRIHDAGHADALRAAGDDTLEPPAGDGRALPLTITTGPAGHATDV